MVVYYTGTGNSRYVAQCFAAALGDDLITANEYIKNDTPAALHSDRPWVFVSPTYGWQIPHIFADFLRRGSFTGSREAYFVMTCGSEIGNAGSRIAALCADIGLDYRGVLEVVILHLTTASPQAVFAALLCFRVIYYLLPLLLAAVIFAIYEVRQQAIQESGVLHDAGRWMRAFAPTIMASAVFGIGAILCFYVVLPVSPERLAQIREWIPLGIVEFASMATGVAGVMLLFLTRGIQHRQRAAFRLAIAMLCIGIIGPLLHSLSWFVALMSLIVLLSVLSIRRKCCRPSSLWKLHLTPSWLFAIVSVLVCSAGLGLLIYHMDPSDPVLWTSSDYAADAARLFRTFAAEALLLICIAVGYMRTAPIRKRWNAVRRFGRRNKQ